MKSCTETFRDHLLTSESFPPCQSLIPVSTKRRASCKMSTLLIKSSINAGPSDPQGTRNEGIVFIRRETRGRKSLYGSTSSSSGVGGAERLSIKHP